MIHPLYHRLLRPLSPANRSPDWISKMTLSVVRVSEEKMTGGRRRRGRGVEVCLCGKSGWSGEEGE